MRNESNFARTRNKRRQVLAKLLVSLGGILIGLLIAEMILRIINYRYLNLYQDDEYVGYALRPGAEGWSRGEGDAYIKINSDGLRDVEHSKVKPADTLRIAVLGDSYAEALQVPAEDAFWAVMGERLRECGAFGGRKIEVINFGVSGFSTARELITLRQRVWRYSPDIVLLLVTTGNDVRDNSRLLNREYAALPLPYFVYRNGALVLDDSVLRARNESLGFRLQHSSLGDSLSWLRRNMRLLGLIDEVRTDFQNYRLKQKTVSRGFGDEAGIDAQVYTEPTSPAWDEAWRVTEGLLIQMRDEVKEHGAKFLVVTGSNGIQVYPDPAVRRDFMRRLGVSDLFYPDRRIKALGEREGFEVLNLAPTLQEYAGQNKAVLHGTNGLGHWNVLGHHLVGGQIAETLCQSAATDR
jgi:hypothetical protein